MDVIWQRVKHVGGYGTLSVSLASFKVKLQNSTPYIDVFSDLSNQLVQSAFSH